MDVKSYNLEDYKKFRLSRSTVTSQFTDLVEFCLISEDESAKHSFHKVCINNWTHDINTLLDTLGEAMSTSLIPLNVCHEHDFISFYTSNLHFVFRAIKSDFTFVHEKKSYHVDEIVFNRASSTDIFGRKSTLEEIIRNIVMLRYSSECKELDLSSFCKDLEFVNFNIFFYKIELLAYYKELMLKMGRETEILNLSNNGLKAVPCDIINFFMKGNLIALNVSNNRINSIQQVRCNSLLEKLWLEGNPVCEDYKKEPYLYVKNLVVKFPRLQWLDDTPVNRSGLIFPFWRTFVVDDDLLTRELVDKFLILYFSHYDETRLHLRNFYSKDCILSISTGFSPEQELQLPHYTTYGRNFLKQNRGQKAYYGPEAVREVIEILPKTTHDPNSFAVDVLKSDSVNIVFVVDGVYKEHEIDNTERLVQFRRTFVLLPQYENNSTKAYYITNDLLTITYPSDELAASCFQTPVRNLNSLMLVNPGSHEIDALTAAFVHQTQLKTEFAMKRLKEQNWDIKKALIKFCTQLRLDTIPRNHFTENPTLNDD